MWLNWPLLVTVAYTTLSSDSTVCRRRSIATRPPSLGWHACDGGVIIGLLQCSTGRSTAGDCRTTTTSSKFSCLFDLQRDHSRARHSVSATFALAAVHSPALYTQSITDVSSVSDEHRRVPGFRPDTFQHRRPTLQCYGCARRSVRVRSHTPVTLLGTR